MKRDCMGTLLKGICFFFLMCSQVQAIEHAVRDWPTEKQKGRLNDCNASAGDKKNHERKVFMNNCLKGEKGGNHQEHQVKKTHCDQQANLMDLKGRDRESFMGSCIKK